MSEVRLSYLGWGTFVLVLPGGLRVVVDPCISPLLGWPHARMHQCRADLFLLTHGHHEHIRDIDRVHRHYPVPLIAPPQVTRYLTQRRGMPAASFAVAHPDQSVELLGLEVVGRSFPHLEKHDVVGKLGVLAQGKVYRAARTVLKNLPTLVRTWAVIHDQPEEGPFLAYDIRVPGGPRVFLSCEAFTHLLPVSQVEAWGKGDPIDLAVIGVETGQEEVAAAQAEALGARTVVAAAVHAPFEEFYGKPRVRPERFLASRGPTWSFWEAGRRETFLVEKRDV